MKKYQETAFTTLKILRDKKNLIPPHIHRGIRLMILNDHARLWKVSFGDILTIGYCESLGKIKQLQKSHLLMVRFTVTYLNEVFNKR